jgi:hypothetical protein
MKFLFLVSALLISFVVSAQNTDKYNTTKHVQQHGLSDPKGFPIWENFEDLLMPPTGWQLLSGPTPETWDTATFDPLWGSGYVRCMYDESLSGTQNEYLITRVIDLRTFTNATLTFNFQFSKYWGISPYDNYDLLVLASTDSAQTFPDTLWTELSIDTATWNSYIWTPATVDLSAYIGQEKFALAFVYTGFDGAEASLDIVSIETVGGMDENKLSLRVYPNPAENTINIESGNSGQLTMTDLQGRIVLQKDFDGNEMLDVTSIEQGRYFVSLRTENAVQNIPVIIMH